MKMTVLGDLNNYIHKIKVRKVLVRVPDPLADESDYFKVRRGPCLGRSQFWRVYHLRLFKELCVYVVKLFPKTECPSNMMTSMSNNISGLYRRVHNLNFYPSRLFGVCTFSPINCLKGLNDLYVCFIPPSMVPQHPTHLLM